MADKDIFYDDDADLSLLDGKTVAVIGYGSQGHAHSLNLKDSGAGVVVGLREESASAEKARGEGLEVTGVADAAARGDIVMMLVPDELHRKVWEGEVAEGIEKGNLLLFATASRSTTTRSRRRPTSTSGSSRPRGPATSSAASTSRAPAFPA